jgi:hypothetical protein
VKLIGFNQEPKVPSLKYMKPGKKWTILAVGSFGSWKTSSVASFAKEGPLWIADFDGRLLPLVEMYKRIPEVYDNITYDSYGPKNYMDFCKAFEKLQDRCDYTTVMIDSITSLSVTIINYSMGVADAKELKLSRFKSGLPIPDWPEFNAEAQQFSMILDIGKVIPAHFICTAHPLTRTKVEAGENGKIKSARSYESLVSAGVKGIELVPNYFNEIWRFNMAKSFSGDGISERHFIKTRPEYTGDLAKTSIGLPEEVDIPDIKAGKLFYDVLQDFLDKKRRDDEALSAVPSVV